jgi:hypothetical protein
VIGIRAFASRRAVSAFAAASVRACWAVTTLLVTVGAFAVGVAGRLAVVFFGVAFALLPQPEPHPPPAEPQPPDPHPPPPSDFPHPEPQPAWAVLGITPEGCVKVPLPPGESWSEA